MDVVNNFEGLSSIAGLQSEMTAAVQRLFANGEGDKIVTERFEVIEQVHDCRILFEQLERSLSSSWDHYFAQASIYYAEHGNLNVPLRYKTPGGLSLGEWVQTQRGIRKGREKYGALTPQQVERLDGIGMIWETRAETAWARGVEAAKRYRQEFGDLQVPSGYKDETGFALGNWIGNTRSRYRSGGLEQKQIDELNALGMVWNSVDARWERCYAEAAHYYERHGDLDFPEKRYVTESGVRLGPWLENQRERLLERRTFMRTRASASGGHRHGVGAAATTASGRQAYAAARRYFAQRYGRFERALSLCDAGRHPAGALGRPSAGGLQGASYADQDKVNRKPLSPERKAVCWTPSGWTGGKKTPGKGTLRLCWPIIKSTAP